MRIIKYFIIKGHKDSRPMTPGMEDSLPMTPEKDTESDDEYFIFRSLEPPADIPPAVDTDSANDGKPRPGIFTSEEIEAILDSQTRNGQTFFKVQFKDPERRKRWFAYKVILTSLIKAFRDQSK